MQHRVIYNKFSLSWLFSFLMFITVTAMAGSNNSQYSLPLTTGQSNPWALPQTSDSRSRYQQPEKYYNQYDGPQSQNQQQQNKVWRNPRERFVTPEFLESLKQQQIQNQLMPGKEQYRLQRQMQSPQIMLQQPLQGNYGYPSYGMGYTNPLYDTPAVSPWSNGSDVLYRGESFPWVPDAAIGGIPPINVEPYIGNNGVSETKPGLNQDQNNVFNPFTFWRNGNL